LIETLYHYYNKPQEYKPHISLGNLTEYIDIDDNNYDNIDDNSETISFNPSFGYIYAFTTDKLREFNIVKIGRTKSLLNRLLSHHIVYGEIDLIWWIPVEDNVHAEKTIFSKIDNYRPHKKIEFFICGVEYAKEILKTYEETNNLKRKSVYRHEDIVIYWFRGNDQIGVAVKERNNYRDKIIQCRINQ
jgi:hypothetical protein